jgi:hypothetical protein
MKCGRESCWRTTLAQGTDDVLELVLPELPGAEEFWPASGREPGPPAAPNFPLATN